MSTATAGPLTAAQIEEFNEIGYVLLPEVFSKDEVARMQEAADKILALCINASIATGKKDVRLDVYTSLHNPDLLDVRKLQPVKDLSETFERLANDERFLSPMRQLMGHEPILMEEKLNYKQKIRCPEYQQVFNPPAGEDVFHLHHDWGYFRMQGYPPETLSSAIALDETTHANGPLRVIPGTHKKEWPLKYPDVNSGNGQVVDGLFTDDDKVELLCPPGSVMLFHAMLLHDSVPNGSDAPRRLMIYSHYPDKVDFPEDERNSWARNAGREIENEYRQLVSEGKYSDVFSL